MCGALRRASPACYEEEKHLMGEPGSSSTLFGVRGGGLVNHGGRRARTQTLASASIGCGYCSACTRRDRLAGGRRSMGWWSAWMPQAATRRAGLDGRPPRARSTVHVGSAPSSARESPARRPSRRPRSFVSTASGGPFGGRARSKAAQPSRLPPFARPTPCRSFDVTLIVRSPLGDATCVVWSRDRGAMHGLRFH